ncbi:2-phospho-L-lactate transferase CofD family protein [Paraglaciecola aquimarina]|uniref:2-phospho-L-lactate transferase CofD family protein n=1 Tax=Paraglaciecola aquimarina TaxID=1235557 RepID=A0ABU3T0Q5_9ALTE|nr:2-phospho-L-lactate transferase CofD family protein [Paraglaciecola aquimarina]MDU0355841.1 2-phospho-L-lactate transferase CofD family protein [Paraglaciecola aquimarina]
MPAIGDLRSRLMALADDTLLGHPEIKSLFKMRLPTDETQQQLKVRLENLAMAKDRSMLDIAHPMRKLICNKLVLFLQHMPETFDLKGANIGNLTLAGGYINNHHKLDPIIFLFSKLVNVQGVVRAVVNENLHLGATLQNGKTILGQHNITGKEVAPIKSPIRSLFLNKGLEKIEPANCQVRKTTRGLIGDADLICYPPEQFLHKSNR